MARRKTTPGTTPKQTTRQFKAQCETCGYTIRISRKWLAEVGAPDCPAGHGKLYSAQWEEAQATYAGPRNERAFQPDSEDWAKFAEEAEVELDEAREFYALESRREGGSVLKDTSVTAAAPHACRACGGAIDPGDTHRVVTYSTGGKLETHRYCQAGCRASGPDVALANDFAAPDGSPLRA